MSANNVGITVTPWVPPTNYCPASYAQLIADAINNSTFVVTQPAANMVLSSVQPSQTAQGTIWLQTSGLPPFTGISPGNATPVAMWSYDNSYGWIWPNPCAPSGAERRLWFASETSLITYDGGDSSALGLASGPMWKVDHTFDQRMLLAPGTLPGAPSGTGATPTVVSVGATGGEQLHQLVAIETTPHNHTFPVVGGAAPSYGTYTYVGLGGNIQVQTTGGTLDLKQDLQPFGGDPLAVAPYSAAAYHNNMPPYIGVFVIQRTSRKYYTLADGQ